MYPTNGHFGKPLLFWITINRVTKCVHELFHKDAFFVYYIWGRSLPDLRSNVSKSRSFHHPNCWIWLKTMPYHIPWRIHGTGIFTYLENHIAIFVWSKRIFPFFCRLRVFAKYVFFQHTGTLFFQQHVEKIQVYYGLAPLRASNTNPNTHMVIFFGHYGVYP